MQEVHKVELKSSELSQLWSQYNQNGWIDILRLQQKEKN